MCYSKKASTPRLRPGLFFACASALYTRAMRWVKAFHIVFVASWFAGLFYLPRIFVNLAMVPAGSGPDRARLLLMSRKLQRFMTIIAVPAIALGLWLWLGFGIGKGAGWMHLKLSVVVLSVGYHWYCGSALRRFERGEQTRGHVWFRWFNEIPLLLFVAAVILVVVKPY